MKSLAGQLLWVSTQTRPDIAYDVCKISNPGKQPQVKSLIFANKTVRKLKSTEGYLVFPKLGKPTDLKVVIQMRHMLL